MVNVRQFRSSGKAGCNGVYQPERAMMDRELQLAKELRVVVVLARTRSASEGLCLS